jgi:biotin transport system substrate-specific component
MKSMLNRKSRGNFMSKELSVSLSPAGAQAAAPAGKAQHWLGSAGIVLAGSAFLAACAHLALPLYFTPVPLTLGPFAVLLLGLILSPRLGAATLVAYLLEGAIGLPVFAPVPGLAGGLAHLLGPTGGYLLAYPAAAALISFLYRRTGRGFGAGLLTAAAGNLMILCCGAVWFAVLSHASLPLVLTQTIVPFLPGDALKIAAAAAIAAATFRLRRKRDETQSNA